MEIATLKKGEAFLYHDGGRHFFAILDPLSRLGHSIELLLLPRQEQKLGLISWEPFPPVMRAPVPEGRLFKLSIRYRGREVYSIPVKTHSSEVELRFIEDDGNYGTRELVHG
jgi:hypothetical protein